ncbi:hypothetical protein [Amycolatopsis alkalitolerans]|uniref:Uncharacterized protein n=1 Tax=Amycolatopsis alkalitolerans TaxID=2547244 RepID=A0A5C4M6V5_9PSEU|nr:hypothetical protein [Amycolatopsis alkalitolerans]TNC29097.1 hypothetical protein FG385_03045 [Amycolatopsis alkalitolerans]
MNEPGPGYQVNPDAVHRIANDLTDAAAQMHRITNEMHTAMFPSTTRLDSPTTVFGNQTPGGPYLGQRLNDLVWALANYGYSLGTTMSDAAGQLHKAGDIYARTDNEVAQKGIPH